MVWIIKLHYEVDPTKICVISCVKKMIPQICPHVYLGYINYLFIFIIGRLPRWLKFFIQLITPGF